MTEYSSAFGASRTSISPLHAVPGRSTSKEVVVLKFGGTTVGSLPEEGRIELARDTIAGLIRQGKFVVPVFSAYRRGRSQSRDKVSVTDLLQGVTSRLKNASDFWQAVSSFHRQLSEIHLGLIEQLGMSHDDALMAQVSKQIDRIKNTAVMCCSALEHVASMEDYLITAGERLVIRILAAYLNQQHRQAEFPLPAEPVTALELGIYTDARFGNASIDWPRAMEHAREVLLGKYLEQGILPMVSGFDGIYDPHGLFPQILKAGRLTNAEWKHRQIYRTSLGRGGSDLTATFLGWALSAEYVAFCKETPGVLSADDRLVGDLAKTVPMLNYELATEAGNIYSKAVQPVRAGRVPVHIFDPATPDRRTIVSDVKLAEGLYLVERPIETVNIHVGSIPDEPGELIKFLDVFARHGVNVEEVRHQRSGTDCIVAGSDTDIQAAVRELLEAGLTVTSQHTWYLRAIGVVSQRLAAEFNAFLSQFQPLTLASYQQGTLVLTATVVRNRAGLEDDELHRIERIATEVHDALITTKAAAAPVKFTVADLAIQPVMHQGR